jgi:hypothetical protein
MDLPDPPEGWELKSLITISEGLWTAQLWAEEAYVYGYGTSPRFAMLDALQKIEDGDTFDRLSGMVKPEIDLVKELGIKPKKMVRRF